MATKLVIAAHGIGDAEEGFHETWEATIRANHPEADFEIKGLLWEDVLQKIADKFPIVSRRFADVLAKFDLEQVKSVVSDNAQYQLIHDYVMDVLVYAGLPDMSQYIVDTCALKLAALCQGREGDTILIGHSLGAAMLPHVVWQEDYQTGTIPYHSLMLLASPLGMESPVPALCNDLLALLQRINGGDRITTLRRFANTWSMCGDNRLHVLINRNDIVCWDVKHRIGAIERDLIPVRQGFSFDELQVLRHAHPGCVHTFLAEDNTVDKILACHDVQTYLKSASFNAAFAQLMKQ